MSVADIESCIRILLERYHAEYALLFGSYARGDATPDSDVDVVVVGGPGFRKTNILAFAEDLRILTGKNVDAFELCELDEGTPIYNAVMREGRRIA